MILKFTGYDLAGVMACTKNNNAVYTTKKKMASNSI